MCPIRKQRTPDFVPGFFLCSPENREKESAFYQGLGIAYRMEYNRRTKGGVLSMKLNVRGANIEVTEALRDYVEKKLGRLEKYFESPPTSDVNVKMSVIKEKEHSVEVTIPFPGFLLRAEVKDGDMYACIDLVVDKLERQIRKHKTKVNRKLRLDSNLRNHFVEDETAPTEAMLMDEENFELVRTKRFTLKPMDVEEAILQMNMVGHNFFVFSNSGDSEQVNVVYKRNDGTYGLIEPAK
jgi:putative sigma-54 modulation protein